MSIVETRHNLCAFLVRLSKPLLPNRRDSTAIRNHEAHRRADQQLPFIPQPTQRARARPKRYALHPADCPEKDRKRYTCIRTTKSQLIHSLLLLANCRPQDPRRREPRRRPRPGIHRFHRQRPLHPYQLPAEPAPADAAVREESHPAHRAELGQERARAEHSCSYAESCCGAGGFGGAEGVQEVDVSVIGG